MEIPQKIHWRIYLDLADLAKRESKFTEARHLYKTVVAIQPYAYQGWLEYAKMEEESGLKEECRAVLEAALKFNPVNENLFIKLIKVEEKLILEGNQQSVGRVRALLASIRREKADIIWRILLEGATFEARLGNRAQAKQQFAELCKLQPHNGLVFLEASKYEERELDLVTSIKICDSGLRQNAKYAPLWI